MYKKILAAALAATMGIGTGSMRWLRGQQCGPVLSGEGIVCGARRLHRGEHHGTGRGNRCAHCD